MKYAIQHKETGLFSNGSQYPSRVTWGSGEEGRLFDSAKCAKKHIEYVKRNCKPRKRWEGHSDPYTNISIVGVEVTFKVIEG